MIMETIFVIVSVVTHTNQTPQVYPSHFSYFHEKYYGSMAACETELRNHATSQTPKMRIGIDHTNSLYAEDASLPIHLRCIAIKLK